MTALKHSTFCLCVIGISLLLSPGCPIRHTTAFARDLKISTPEAPAEAFCGETLYYDVGFWLLPRAGTCRLTFNKKNNTYVAVLEAWPKGFIKVFIPYKKEIMKSVMEYDPKNRRMRPLEFHETYIMEDFEIKKTLIFDYSKQVYHFAIQQNERHLVNRTYRLPGKQFDDILTFIYNLRLGSYGRINEGRKLIVSVLMRQKPSRISLHFDKQFLPQQESGKYHAILSLDRNLTNARSNTISCWFSEEFIPLGGMIEDAVFFGDLYIKLSKREP